MSHFNKVSITKAANIYFEGKVTSRTITFEDGSIKSLGIMLPGDYEFNTDNQELMEIMSGEMEVLLPGSDWINVQGGQNFEVPAHSNFQLKVKSISDYCCSYIND